MPELRGKAKTPIEAGDEKADAIHFDVAREAWMEVLRADGTSGEVGLIEALCEAHLLRAICDPLPPVECALLRLLVAFALDIFQPQNAKDWKKVWDAGCFAEARVRDYFERHANRFDLFDATHPFLQDGAAGGEDKPLAGLLPSHSMTNSELFFHHIFENDFHVSPAVAARLLTTVSCFSIAGGRGWSPSINGAPPWYVLLQGNNLFQTIWLNCPVLSDLLPTATGNNPPAWRDDRVISQEERTDASLLEALTWRPRGVRLLPHFVPHKRGTCALSGRETPVLVGRMKTAYGWKTRFDWRDPHAAYRITKDGPRILRANEGREVWRDVGALALLRQSESIGRDFTCERPAVVTQFAEFVQTKRLPEDTPLNLTVYALRTRDAKVLEWHRETLTLPTPLLWERKFHIAAEAAMKLAEDVEFALRYAIKQTHPRDEKQKLRREDKAFDALVLRAQNEFWQRLRPHYAEPPDSLLYRLAPLQPESDQEAIEAAVAAWQEVLGRVARQTLDNAIGDLDTDGAAMKRQVEAQRIFRSRLWALLNPVAAAAAKEKKKKHE